MTHVVGSIEAGRNRVIRVLHAFQLHGKAGEGFSGWRSGPAENSVLSSAS